MSMMWLKLAGGTPRSFAIARVYLVGHPNFIIPYPFLDPKVVSFGYGHSYGIRISCMDCVWKSLCMYVLTIQHVLSPLHSLH